MFQSITSLFPILIRLLIIISFLCIIDVYAYQAIKNLTENLKLSHKKIIKIFYWSMSASLYILFILLILRVIPLSSRSFITFISVLFFSFILSKLLMSIPLILEDIYRILHKIISFFITSDTNENKGLKLISRKKFISQVSAGLGALTFSGIVYGATKGSHHYKIHRKSIALKQLPNSFKNLKIAQLSDIHCGSFWNKQAVSKGIDMLLAEKPDMILFTGDLVNSITDELNSDYQELFSKLKAPLGVYSVLGNHDYGDYYQWPDKKFDMKMHPEKLHMSPLQKENLSRLIETQKKMGWDVLLNEHRIIKKGEDELALIGIENYGAKGQFAKYGKLDVAYAGTENHAIKILMSHDPSHWNYEVTKKYKDINLTLSGHTHGAQFGIETGGFQWSPIKYRYKEWAGLYEQDEQLLYVNRGFGYLGYPGRLGIRPEITIITLV